MFGNNDAPRTTGLGATNQAQTPMPGVSSTFKELSEEVLAVCKYASDLRQTLGISQPEVGTGGPPSNDMASQLRGLLYSLREANGTFSECLRHLNS